MNSPAVAITGASSFTGLWIARSFARSGWKVWALAARQPSLYSGLPLARLETLKKEPSVEIVWGMDVEESGLLAWIGKQKPTIWVHHHHWMQNYRSKSYDMKRAMEIGTKPLEKLFSVFKGSGLQGCIYSGTYFEGTANPYGESKALVWKHLSELAHTYRLALSKIVIPDPIGPYENTDRLIPVLVEKAARQEGMTLWNPDQIQDHLPADCLGEVYVQAARAIMEGRSEILRPTGWVGPLSKWVQEIQQELIITRLKMKKVSIKLEIRDEEAASYRNDLGKAAPIDWQRFWDECAAYYQSNFNLPNLDAPAGF